MFVSFSLVGNLCFWDELGVWKIKKLVIPLIPEIERFLKANQANQKRERMEWVAKPRDEIEDARVKQA